MRKVQCLNKHYYDADQNKLCPHCGAAEAKKIPPGIVDVPRVGVVSRREIPAFGQTDYVSEPQGGKKEKKKGKKGKLFSWGRGRERSAADNVAEQAASSEYNWKETEQAPALPDEKTVSIYADKYGAEPVTGWLVAVSGAYYGQDFPLRTGKNFIGRDISMDICLAHEINISRIRHAIIVFEPKHGIFLLSGGEGSGLTYCNNELVLGTVPLKPYDRLQFGEAEFVFLPLCGELFRWG